MNADEKLRAILRAEADEVSPGAEGWDRIRDGIVARRRRTGWLRGSAAAATVLSVAAAAALVVRVSDRDQPHVIGNDPTASAPASASASPAPTPTPAQVEVYDVVWPFTDSQSVAEWRVARGNGASDADTFADPASTARAFVDVYLAFPGATVTAVPGGTGHRKFAVRRQIEGATQAISITTLTVRRLGADGPWTVVSADAPNLTITTPAAGAEVSSPLQARGTYRDVDPSYEVELRRQPTSPRDRGGRLAVARALTAPEGWSATLGFPAPPDDLSGSLVITAGSPADGRLGMAVVRPIRFAGTDGPAPTPTESPVARPRVFVAVVDQRVAVLDGTTGKVLRYLTEDRPGSVMDVSLSPDGTTVWYAESAGTCASGIWNVPLAGGTPSEVVDAGNGAVFAPATNDDGALAYLRVDCARGGSDTELVVVDAHGSDFRVDVPDTTRGPLAWVAGGRVAMVTGSDAATSDLTVVDPFEPNNRVSIRPSEGCTWTAVTARPTGGIDELLAAQACAPGTDGKRSTVLVAMPAFGGSRKTVADLGAVGVQSIDYDRAGKYLLIWRAAETGIGATEVWNGSTDPKPIASNAQHANWS